MERIEELGDGLKIIQDKNLYTFTSDSVILANFVTLKKKEKAVEIGTGSGVISILVAGREACECASCACPQSQAPSGGAVNHTPKLHDCYKSIIAFEVQKKLADMAKRSLELNGISNIKIVNDKIQNFKKYVSEDSFDVVFSNPPYKKKGTSFINENESKAIARHEIELDLENLVKCASSLLKTKGRFYVMYDANRVAEIIFKLKQNRLEPKEMFFTYANGKEEAVLVVIKAVKDAAEGCIVRRQK